MHFFDFKIFTFVRQDIGSYVVFVLYLNYRGLILKKISSTQHKVKSHTCCFSQLLSLSLYLRVWGLGENYLRRQVKVSNDVTQVGKILNDIQGNPGTTPSFFSFRQLQNLGALRVKKNCVQQICRIRKKLRKHGRLVFILRGSIEG